MLTNVILSLPSPVWPPKPSNVSPKKPTSAPRGNGEFLDVVRLCVLPEREPVETDRSCWESLCGCKEDELPLAASDDEVEDAACPLSKSNGLSPISGKTRGFKESRETGLSKLRKLIGKYLQYEKQKEMEKGRY
jgi:hypothetical protein